jgi:GH15 family glucan-1,4-alpha-glucosidase
MSALAGLVPASGAERMHLDHAAIGNGRVLALVGPDASVDWLCWPRFDSPSLFGRLLDEHAGGRWEIASADPGAWHRQQYVVNTNVSRIEARQGEHAWEILDFAPRLPDGLGVRCPRRLVRLVRPLAGRPRLRVVFDPRPDYARRHAELRTTDRGLRLHGDPDLRLDTSLPAAFIADGHPFALDEPAWLVLRDADDTAPLDLPALLREYQLTVDGWRHWVRTCALPAYAPEAVLRSALCLKLHLSEETGAVIAAATTSIPEALGTPRTWDYRYCWLRDAVFVVEALRSLGHLDEGARFLRFLRDVAEAGPLQPVYGIGGERQLDEAFLPHLAGFRGNGHVRIGNAAYVQRQHDLMGELLLCLAAMLGDPRLVHDDPHVYFPLVRRLVEEARVAATQPDMGIWEFRTMLRPYTFSRAMCWAALDRGAVIAARLGERALADEWSAAASREAEEILRRGFSETHGCFTQALDGAFPDASNLLLPSLGLLRADDPRFLRTLDVYEQRLARNGLLLRYANADDFGDTTTAFTLCSLWWAAALAQAGRTSEAIAVFERVAAHANPVGLFSEDIDPATGDLLGNFPQAYTHVGLIHAAHAIGSALEARDGHRLAWT